MEEVIVEPTVEPVIEEKTEKNPLVDKLKKEKDNWRTKAVELESKLKLKEEEELKIKENYKGIAELKEREANDWKTRYEQQQTKIIQAQKFAALKSEFIKLGADQKTIEPLLRLADVGQVKYDEDNAVVYGAEEVAKAVKEQIPMAFGKPSAGVNHDAPDTKVDSIDMEKFKSMSLEDKKKYQFELQKKMGITLKK